MWISRCEEKKLVKRLKHPRTRAGQGSVAQPMRSATFLAFRIQPWGREVAPPPKLSPGMPDGLHFARQ